MNNAVAKLIENIKLNARALAKDSSKVNEFCRQLEEMGLPELDGEREYTYRIKCDDGKMIGSEIISQRKFWSEELNCWRWDEEEVHGLVDTVI